VAVVATIAYRACSKRRHIVATVRGSLLTIAAALVAAPILGGTAQAFFNQSSLSVNFGDAYTISCSATTTKCVEMETCDLGPGGDIFEQVLSVSSPATLFGRAEDNRAFSLGCTGFQTICRGGTSVGSMKGLAVITLPTGSDGDSYSVEIHCLDKNSNVLPEATLKVKQTEFNH
jgi:hypothetical protein